MGKKKTKSYPESFRKEAVKLANLPERTAGDVANELRLHAGQIYNWRTKFSKLSKGQLKSMQDWTTLGKRMKRYESLSERSRNYERNVTS